jgi:hypothetical protein
MVITITLSYLLWFCVLLADVALWLYVSESLVIELFRFSQAFEGPEFTFTTFNIPAFVHEGDKLLVIKSLVPLV